MAKVYSTPVNSWAGYLVGSGGTGAGEYRTWTDPDGGAVYTIKDGFQRVGGGPGVGETNDNVQYQYQPDGTVYVYTVHNDILRNTDLAGTPLNETVRHTGIVTYAVDRADDGTVSVNIVHIQDNVVDANGKTFALLQGAINSGHLEMADTPNGKFLILTHEATAANPDNDADQDTLETIATFAMKPDGSLIAVDAKVWDSNTTGGLPGDQPSTDSDLVNVAPNSPYVADNAGVMNFEVVTAPDGTPVIMQHVAGKGTLTTLLNDGKLGPVTTVSPLGSAYDPHYILFNFANGAYGDNVSVTVGEKTFVYAGSHATSEYIARAELTVDPTTNVATLSNYKVSTNYQSNTIFQQGTTGTSPVEIDGPDTHNIVVAAPDIGDGKKYLFIGNYNTWQFFQVHEDGSLSAASDLGNATSGKDSIKSTNFGAGPYEGVQVVQHTVNGITYTGWLMQNTTASNNSWHFYNPTTGFVTLTPATDTTEEPGLGKRGYYMINGHKTWIGLKNQSEGTDSGTNNNAIVTNGGTDIAPVFCFAAGTQILTDRGEVQIENLRVGDMVQTLDSGLQPIRWITSRDVSAQELANYPKLRPIHISGGALGSNIPHRTLKLSPQHRVMLRSNLIFRMFGHKEVLTAAKNLVNYPGIYVSEEEDDVKYFHLMFDKHEILFADGLLAESMLAGSEAQKSIPPEAIKELHLAFPGLQKDNTAHTPARYIAGGAKIRRFLERSFNNSQRLSI